MTNPEIATNPITRVVDGHTYLLTTWTDGKYHYAQLHGRDDLGVYRSTWNIETAIQAILSHYNFRHKLDYNYLVNVGAYFGIQGHEHPDIVFTLYEMRYPQGNSWITTAKVVHIPTGISRISSSERKVDHALNGVLRELGKLYLAQSTEAKPAPETVAYEISLGDRKFLDYDPIEPGEGLEYRELIYKE